MAHVTESNQTYYEVLVLEFRVLSFEHNIGIVTLILLTSHALHSGLNGKFTLVLLDFDFDKNLFTQKECNKPEPMVVRNSYC